MDDIDARVTEAERYACTNIEAVETEEFNQWTDLEKDWLTMVSRDVSDAKRRVNLTKGPAKKKKSNGNKTDDNDVSAEEEVSEESTS